MSLELCMLGLPAVAKIRFDSADVVNNILASYEKSGIEDSSGRLILVRGESTNNPISRASLELKNRHIALTEVPTDMLPQQLFAELSRFGRITYFDMPLNIRRRATKE